VLLLQSRELGKRQIMFRIAQANIIVFRQVQVECMLLLNYEIFFIEVHVHSPWVWRLLLRTVWTFQLTGVVNHDVA